MRIVYCVLALALAASGLILVQHSVAAGRDTSADSPRGDEQPEFTRIATITVEAGPPLTPALSSYWETLALGYGGGGVEIVVGLPSDSTDVTASVTGGTYTLIGASIVFSLTAPSCNFYYGFRTHERVIRQGNQYRISQAASANTSFLYSSTLIFTAPYQFVGYTGTVSATIDTHTARWGLVVPDNAQGFHRFRSSAYLVDPRVGRPDIEIITASLHLIDPDADRPAAHLTTALHNRSLTVETGAPAFIALYDRSAPISPTGPLDQVDTWCSTVGANPECPSSTTFTNPVPLLAPNETITLSTDYTFTNGGVRNLYLQVDAFGGSAGLNFESNETNNQIGVGQIEIELADLAIDKRVDPNPALVGKPLTYTLRITNAGPTVANMVTLTDQLPNGVIFGGAAGSGWLCNHTNGLVTCTTATVTLTTDAVLITVTAPSSIGLIMNTASITSASPDWNADNNKTSVTTTVAPVADLTISASQRPYPARVGETLTYTLHALNTGPNAATLITVTNQLPGEITFGGAWGVGWTCHAAGNLVACTRPDLSVAGDTVFVTGTAPNMSTVITTVASITAATFDPNFADNTIVIETPVKKFYSIYLPLTLKLS